MVIICLFFFLCHIIYYFNYLAFFIVYYLLINWLFVIYYFLLVIYYLFFKLLFLLHIIAILFLLHNNQIMEHIYICEFNKEHVVYYSINSSFLAGLMSLKYHHTRILHSWCLQSLDILNENAFFIISSHNYQNYYWQVKIHVERLSLNAQENLKFIFFVNYKFDSPL